MSEQKDRIASRLPKQVRRRVRVGRGIGSGIGKTSGRGQKGQYARSKVRPGFEGGQIPLYRRLPKHGFTPVNRLKWGTVAVRELNLFANGAEVNPEGLKDAGLVRKSVDAVKILAGGKLKKSLTVSAHGFSAVARQTIESAGGQVRVVSHSG